MPSVVPTHQSREGNGTANTLDDANTADGAAWQAQPPQIVSLRKNLQTTKNVDCDKYSITLLLLLKSCCGSCASWPSY